MTLCFVELGGALQASRASFYGGGRRYNEKMIDSIFYVKYTFTG